jgi:hypothetical protein
MPQLKKADLVEVFNALGSIVNGDVQADGSLRRYRVPPKVQATLGRAYRELKPKVMAFQDDVRDQEVVFADGKDTIPRMIRGPDGAFIANPRYLEFREARRGLLEETVECPYTVRLADFPDDCDAPVAGLGELVKE